MPAKSQAQKNFMQLALAVKKGDVDKSEVSQDVIDAAEEMSEKELKKFAEEPVEESLREAVRQLIVEEANGYRFSTDASENPIGLVPKQERSGGNRLRVQTRCSEFLKMARTGAQPSDWLEEQIRDGRPLAPPFLQLVYVKSAGAWYVRSHEGRSRCKTIMQMTGGDPTVPVDLFLKKKQRVDEYPSDLDSPSTRERQNLRRRVVPEDDAPIREDRFRGQPVEEFDIAKV